MEAMSIAILSNDMLISFVYNIDQITRDQRNTISERSTRVRLLVSM